MTLDIKDLPLEVLAGQKLITGINGTKLNTKTKEFIKKVKPGGVILFARNIENKAQLKKLNSDIIAFYKDNNLPPPFISIDQEGGSVARLKQPEFRELGPISKIDTKKDAKDHAFNMCQILKELDFNMNMAPVLDIASILKNSIMKSRSFKGAAKDVSKLGCIMIQEYIDNSIIPVGKHFPGIGGTDLDSHLCLPKYDKDYEFMLINDLLPFIDAINQQLPGIMFSHILYSKLDSKWPASLSKIICKEILREKLGFDKITMTDDLDMKAITCDIQTASKQIIEADQDIALICHSFDNVDLVYNCFLNEMKNENMPVFESVKRIFKVKNRFLY